MLGFNNGTIHKQELCIGEVDHTILSPHLFLATMSLVHKHCQLCQSINHMFTQDLFVRSINHVLYKQEPSLVNLITPYLVPTCINNNVDSLKMRTVWMNYFR